MTGAGRNDPCPCGSGKKYKHCCLRAEEVERVPKLTPAMQIHHRDEGLTKEMLRFARSRFGERYLRDAADVCMGSSAEIDEIDAQLVVPWMLYHHHVGGLTAADLFIEERGARLNPADRAWIEAQRAARFSVWEVAGVQPGVGLTMTDLLTGVSRFVDEQRGSRVLVRRDAVLARVVDSGELSVFSGMHPQPLPPSSAAALVGEVLDLIDLKDGDEAPEGIRGSGVDRMLLAAWRAAVEALNRRPLPELRNTDGDPLQLTTDHYAFRPQRRAEVETKLASLEGNSREESEDGDTCFTFTCPGNKKHRDWENTIVGQAVVSRDSVRLETNSRRRADALRKRVEHACGDLVKHRSRSEEDMESIERSAREGSGVRDKDEGTERSPEMMAVTREFKERHYASWVDDSIPALGGMTPRKATETARGRAMLDGLLKEMENLEARLPVEEQYDFGALRRRLGM